MNTKNKRPQEILIFLFIVFIFLLAGKARAQNLPAVPANIPQKYQALINNYVSGNAPLPAITLPGIRPGATVSGNLSFDVQIPGIKGLTAELVPAGATTPAAFGTATKLENNYWAIHFNAKNLPDGKYDLTVDFTNPSSQTEAVTVPIMIKNTGSEANNPASPVDQNDVNQWLARIQATSPQKIQQNVNQFLDSLLPAAWLEKYFHASVCTDENICGALADPDHDGLVNLEEYRLGTDPTNPETAGLGHSDGWEVANGLDPLTGTKLNYQSPKESRGLTSALYKVLKAAAVQTKNSRGITLAGSGLPDSYLTVFVYSDLPTILTVKTDANGDWSYTLANDGGLADGQHEVYVAVTDATGQITVKSQPLFFIKTAEAIDVVPPTEASGPATSSPVESRQWPYLLTAVVVAGLAFLLALLTIGFSLFRKNKKTNDNPPQP